MTGANKSAKFPSRAPILTAAAILIFAFIYLPIVVLIVYSFNRDGVGGFPPQHLTLDWYRQLFSDGAIWDAVLNSVIVAAASVALALTLGLLAALDIAAADPAPRTVRCMTPHIAEPEADSDRTVHPKMWQTLVPNEMDLLRRRLAELEKLANETAAYLVNPSGSRISVLARARDRWLKTLADAS